ncbi:hypothetical protein [Lysobacter enzymogenes]|uniref:hypothetical protein n=1 Tax=Lysobacter enzymogenes TaxID=69 RepID=UPI001A959CA5|nr:hypothetical protein [Lysobacter enzymogenes]QQP95872.1 hypothetical protein JHW38_22075 [Lysobacter enzymogenes]
MTWWDNSSFFQSLWGYLALAAIFALGKGLIVWVFLSSPRLTLWFLAAELVLACVVIAARRWARSGAKALPWCEWPLQGIFALQTIYFGFVFAVGCYWFGTGHGLLTALVAVVAFAAMLWADQKKPQWSRRMSFAGSLALTVVNVWIYVKIGHSVVLPFVFAPMVVVALLIAMVSVRRAAAERRSWNS